MRIAIVGSRKYPFMAQVADYVCSLPFGTVVISGGAPGVDSYAVWAAEERGLEVEIIEADWDRYRPSDPRRKNPAGVIRDKILVRANLDRLTAFWDGSSPGTRFTFTEARKVLGYERVEVRTP